MKGDEDQRHVCYRMVIRPDGRMMHDMYLMQVKTPAESKYPWDYYKLVATVPGEQAFDDEAPSRNARSGNKDTQANIAFG